MKVLTLLSALVVFLLGCSDNRAPKKAAVPSPVAHKEHASAAPLKNTPALEKAELREAPGKKASQSKLKPSLPHVELDPGEWATCPSYGTMAGKEWNGHPLREIVSPSSISRIIRVRDDGFDSKNDEVTEQRYNSLMTHLFQSDEQSRDFGLLALERPVATFVLLTRSSDVYEIVVQETIDRQVSSIYIGGQGKGARIEVKEFKQRAPLPRLR
jgi:hypothetical protein